MVETSKSGSGEGPGRATAGATQQYVRGESLSTLNQSMSTFRRAAAPSGRGRHNKRNGAKMKSSMMIGFLLMAALHFGGWARLFAQSNTAASGQGNTKLKEQLQELGIADFWIYDDLEFGFAQAKKTGKPLLLVFR